MPNVCTVLVRVVVAVLVLGALSAPALGDDIVAKKQHLDSNIQALQAKLAHQHESEQALQAQVDALTSRIQGLESQVGDVSAHLGTLQQDLSLHRQRLAALTSLVRDQSRRLAELRREYSRSVRRLDRRLVTIYETGLPSTLDVVLGASSIDDALNLADYASLIGKQDRRVAAEVAAAKLRMAAAKKRTAALRLRVQGEEHAIAARAAQEQETRDALLGAQNQLAQSRQQKVVALGSLSAQERALAQEIDQEQAASAQLGAQIRAAQARSSDAPDSTPSSAGLVWPVSGPITSPFGMRWGRMHEGVDIGVPSGTPIHAAAAGTVIYCGWETGYGNLVVLDNGGNLATAYAHQSAIAVSCGQHVEQGQVLGYVGCTGHCFGPHLHFEVRIGGSPVDPLGYL